MIKFISYLFQALLVLLLTAALIIGLAFVGLIVLKPQLDHELQRLVKKTEGRNIEINFLDYGKIRLSRLGIVFGPIRARGVTRIQYPYFDPREFSVSIKKVRVGLQGITKKSFDVSAEIEGMDAKGGRIFTEDKEDSHERLESVSELNLKTSIHLEASPLSWKTQFLKRAKQFKAWAFEDQEMTHLDLKGRAVFIVDDWPIAVQFQSATGADGTVHLEGASKDLRVIAEMIEPKFTDADLQLASKNLLKTPKLLKFRVAAENQATRLKGRDPQIVYDVPRHIYWSYFLAKAYGAEFAREATNAHEIGDQLNSAVESDKDRHHNSLGIEYAQKNLSESEVEKMIFSDSRILRLKPNTSPEKKSAGSSSL